jgi:chromosomal replication initiation ATPase DnaA
VLPARRGFNRIKALGEQLRLNLHQPLTFRRESFVVSACNAEAAARIDAWPRWTLGALALVGPAGAGKTHLALAWASRAGARIADFETLDPETDINGPLLIENADRGFTGERLFHLLNRAGDPEHGVLLTARSPPATWPAALPDLRSRLNALPVVELDQPDDGVLGGALRRLFAERLIRPSPELIAYLVARMERSVPAAAALVDRLEAASSGQGRPLSRSLAREVLAVEGGEDETDT